IGRYIKLIMDAIVAALKPKTSEISTGNPIERVNHEFEIDDFFLNMKNIDSIVRKAGEKEWFLSSVVVAISRALGIPTRTVTVINSNFALKNKLIIDYKQISNLKQFEQNLYTDYDLWIEIWGRRDDNSDSGWHVIDYGIDEKGLIGIKGPISVSSIWEGKTENEDSNYFLCAINGCKQQEMDSFLFFRDKW
ncbi:hypothetical protein B4U80_12107, partial [Leptotrombidium deliense]